MAQRKQQKRAAGRPPARGKPARASALRRVMGQAIITGSPTKAMIRKMAASPLAAVRSAFMAIGRILRLLLGGRWRALRATVMLIALFSAFHVADAQVKQTAQPAVPNIITTTTTTTPPTMTTTEEFQELRNDCEIILLLQSGNKEFRKNGSWVSFPVGKFRACGHQLSFNWHLLSPDGQCQKSMTWPCHTYRPGSVPKTHTAILKKVKNTELCQSTFLVVLETFVPFLQHHMGIFQQMTLSLN